jgi:uncharacterized protein YndB with AHSA1/START domain
MKMNTNKTTNNLMVITRIFDAPRELVYTAWTIQNTW